MEGWQKKEVRSQKSEVRKQKVGGLEGWQKTEVRSQKIEGRSQKTEDRSRKSEVRRQKTEGWRVGGVAKNLKRKESRIWKSEVKKLYSLYILYKPKAVEVKWFQ